MLPILLRLLLPLPLHRPIQLLALHTTILIDQRQFLLLRLLQIKRLLPLLDKFLLLGPMVPDDILLLVLGLLRFLPRLHRQQRAFELLFGRWILSLVDLVFELLHLVVSVAFEERVVLFGLDLVEGAAQGLKSRITVLALGGGDGFALERDGFLARHLGRRVLAWAGKVTSVLLPGFPLRSFATFTIDLMLRVF